jgi:hypothetical protein
MPATKTFFEAVEKICPSKSNSKEGEVEEGQSEAFDDATAEDKLMNPEAFEGWNFAHMSFDDEIRMIWRWWIWK